MRTQKLFDGEGDRYQFDFKLCTAAKGWAQIDSGHDASYYGNWANPTRRKIVSFCEGDVTIRTAETEDEFVTALREAVRWNQEHTGKGAIDAMCNADLISAFERIGCADLLH